jgi:hypothetical protein
MKCTLAFSRTKSAHNNQLEMALEDGRGAVMALKNGGSLVALGGGVGRRMKIIVAALGSSGGRRTCHNGIGVIIIEAEGLQLGRWHQRQQGWQERMLQI